MVKKWTLYVLIISIVTAITACNQSNTSPNIEKTGQMSAGEETNVPNKMDKITITSTHYPGYIGAPAIQVGMEKGFFKEEAIQIEGVIKGEGGGTTIRNVLSGDLPIGEVSLSAAVTSFQAGAPIVIIGGGVRTSSATYLVTRPDAPYQRLEDLIGRKIAATQKAGSYDVLYRLMFKSVGLKPNDIEVVYPGGGNEALTMLKNGGVDAAPILDPLFTVKKGEYKLVARMSDYVPKIQTTVLVTSPKLIKENPDLIRRFMNAYKKSVEWIYQNPGEAGKIMAKYAEVDEEAAIVTQVLAAKDKIWSHKKVDVDAYNVTLEGMILVGELKEGTKIAWDQLLNQDFMDEKIDTKQLIGAQ